MMSQIRDANIIKAMLVDFLISKDKSGECMYGSELFYGSKKRQADFVSLNGYATAYEIKSDGDDFRRLREQLDDYVRVFDYQYLVTTNRHADKAVEILKPGEGLIIINNKANFVVKRRAKRITAQNKMDILHTIPAYFLRKYFKMGGLYKSASDVRNELAKRSLDEIVIAFRSFLKEHLNERNNYFLAEKGCITHFEDIRLLSRHIDLIV